MCITVPDKPAREIHLEVLTPGLAEGTFLQACLPICEAKESNGEKGRGQIQRKTEEGSALRRRKMGLLRFCPYFVLAVMLLGPVQRTAACSCFPTHPQTAFCKSDFTAVIRVKGQRVINQMEVEYKVKYQKVFKSSPAFDKVMEKGTLWTGANSAMCGVELKVGTNYVVSGNVFEDRPRISLCTIVKPWSDVTGRQRKAYRQLYRHGCGCEISFTSWSRKGAVYETVGGKQCLWESMPGPQECQELYGVCMRGPAGCSWKPTLGYKNCIKEHQWKREHQRHKEP